MSEQTNRQVHSRVSESREHHKGCSENENFFFFFFTFRQSYHTCIGVTVVHSGSKVLLEIMVISMQKSPRMMTCMHSGEQKCQNGPENQLISKLCLENRKFFLDSLVHSYSPDNSAGGGQILGHRVAVTEPPQMRVTYRIVSCGVYVRMSTFFDNFIQTLRRLRVFFNDKSALFYIKSRQ